MKTILNPPANEKWIQNIGKYMINMGTIEAMTRFIIARLNNSDQISIYHDDLSCRCNYLRARVPNKDISIHKSAMTFFEVIGKHITFRNVVAHSAVVLADAPNGEKIVVGLMNLKPNDPNNVGEIISDQEMTGRIDESVKLINKLTELQHLFTLERTY